MKGNNYNHKVNWDQAERSYLLDGIPYRELARQFGVTRQAVEVQGKKRNWAEKKRQVNESQSDKFTAVLKQQNEAIGQNLGQELGDRISQIKRIQLEQSEKLVETGMNRLTGDKIISDAVAIQSVKLGQETIRELEGMKQAQQVTNILVINEEEKMNRLKRLAEEVKYIE